MTNVRNSIRIEKVTKQVVITSIFVNVLLSLMKLSVGIVSSSGAMISDAVHSAADVFSAFIVIFGIKMTRKGYVHFERMALMILGVILCVTGFGIGYRGIWGIMKLGSEEMNVPGITALVVSGFSIAVKEFMYWYVRGAASLIDSAILLAEAWHHRSDALVSAGGFIGILGTRVGIAVMDSAASVLISLIICKAAFSIIRSADRKEDKSGKDYDGI